MPLNYSFTFCCTKAYNGIQLLDKTQGKCKNLKNITA